MSVRAMRSAPPDSASILPSIVPSPTTIAIWPSVLPTPVSNDLAMVDAGMPTANARPNDVTNSAIKGLTRQTRDERDQSGYCHNGARQQEKRVAVDQGREILPKCIVTAQVPCMRYSRSPPCTQPPCSIGHKRAPADARRNSFERLH